MAAITAVFTSELVAQMLEVDEKLISDIAMTDTDPEHGHLWIYGIGDQEVEGFTQDGIHHLRELIADRKTSID